VNYPKIKELMRNGATLGEADEKEGAKAFCLLIAAAATWSSPRRPGRHLLAIILPNLAGRGVPTTTTNRSCGSAQNCVPFARSR